MKDQDKIDFLKSIIDEHSVAQPDDTLQDMQMRRYGRMFLMEVIECIKSAPEKQNEE